MTTSEQRVLWRGVAAGTMMGLAIGLILALFIAIRPERNGVNSLIVYFTIAISLVLPIGIIVLGGLLPTAQARLRKSATSSGAPSGCE
jgi:formate/nitrite transporter FocA (FNT family)